MNGPKSPNKAHQLLKRHHLFPPPTLYSICSSCRRIFCPRKMIRRQQPVQQSAAARARAAAGKICSVCPSLAFGRLRSGGEGKAHHRSAHHHQTPPPPPDPLACIVDEAARRLKPGGRPKIRRGRTNTSLTGWLPTRLQRRRQRPKGRQQPQQLPPLLPLLPLQRPPPHPRH